jgi:hypothetical protein
MAGYSAIQDRLGLDSSQSVSSGSSASVMQLSQISSGGGAFDFKISVAPRTYRVFSALGCSYEFVGRHELEVSWSFVLFFGSS